MILKKIKRLFVIEEEGANQPVAAKKESKPAAKRSSSDVVRKESSAGQPGKVVAQFTEVLLKAMEQKNIEGFDYLEFKESLHSLKKMPLDEPTRYQSAFAMARTMGATPETLIETAQHYLAILQQEEDKFDQALQKQKTGRIGKKEQEIQNLESIIKQKEQQIQQLTKEIESHRADSEKLRAEISDDTLKVESTKNDFIASYNNLVRQVQQDLENMKKYLK